MPGEKPIGTTEDLAGVGGGFCSFEKFFHQLWVSSTNSYLSTTLLQYGRYPN